jgi:hypothetical protein
MLWPSSTKYSSTGSSASGKIVLVTGLKQVNIYLALAESFPP